MADRKITLEDTFENWLEKINAFQDDSAANLDQEVTELQTQITDNKALYDAYVIEQQKTPFVFLMNESSALNLRLKGGKVRNGSSVTVIPDTTLTLPANSNLVVGLYQARDAAPTLAFYTLDQTPVNLFIPLYAITTNATGIATYNDLRTGYAFSSGNSSSTEAVLQFDKHITYSLTIPSDKNALSIGPIVDEGVTVTVAEDAEWVIL